MKPTLDPGEGFTALCSIDESGFYRLLARCQGGVGQKRVGVVAGLATMLKST